MSLSLSFLPVSAPVVKTNARDTSTLRSHSPHQNRLHNLTLTHFRHSLLKVLDIPKPDELLDGKDALAPPVDHLRDRLARPAVSLHRAAVRLAADHKRLHVQAQSRLGHARADLNHAAHVARAVEQRGDERGRRRRVDGDGDAQAAGRRFTYRRRDLLRRHAARVDGVCGAQGFREREARRHAINAHDGFAAAQFGGHNGSQSHAAHAQNRDAVARPGLRDVGDSAAAGLQAAAQRRQQLEVGAREVEWRDVDDAFGRYNGVLCEARLAEEAAMDAVAAAGVAAGRGEDGLADKVDFEKARAVRWWSSLADVTGAAVGK